MIVTSGNDMPFTQMEGGMAVQSKVEQTLIYHHVRGKATCTFYRGRCNAEGQHIEVLLHLFGHFGSQPAASPSKQTQCNA